MNNGGDVLARGGKSAQFGGATTITEFENDFIYMEVEEVLMKYSIAKEEYDQYSALRLDGQHLPDLTPVALQETLDVGFSITDSRKNYLSEATEPSAVKKEVAKKFPEPTFETMQ